MTAARITYLGEGLWPSPEIEWNDIVFPLHEAVEIADPAMIRKASANPAFKVELDKPETEPAENDPPHIGPAAPPLADQVEVARQARRTPPPPPSPPRYKR